MLTRIQDDPAQLLALAHTRVSVCGRGAEAIPLALCVRDSGVAVQVVLAETDPQRELAQAEGLTVVTPSQLSHQPDQQQLILLTGLHQPRQLAALDAQVVAHAVVVATMAQFGGQPGFAPGQVDAYLVPQGPPAQVRQRFCDGGAVSAVLALAGQTTLESPATAQVVGLARALGLTKASVVMTTQQALDNSWTLAYSTVGVAGMASLVGASVAVQKQVQVPIPVAMMVTVTALRQALDVLTATGALTVDSARSAWGPAQQLSAQVQQWWQAQATNSQR